MVTNFFSFLPLSIAYPLSTTVVEASSVNVSDRTVFTSACLLDFPVQPIIVMNSNRAQQPLVWSFGRSTARTRTAVSRMLIAVTIHRMRLRTAVPGSETI